MRNEPYEVEVYAQDPSQGRVGVVLDAIEATAKKAGFYDAVDVAVAYASAGGVRLLNERLSGAVWDGSRKRFLVSIDFGFTQPKALEQLSKLYDAEVRIPNGRIVLASPTLQPKSAFHAKTFAFSTDETEAMHGNGFYNPRLIAITGLRGLNVGSANLTASALTTGSEVVVRHNWIGNPDTVGFQSRMNSGAVLDWFEDAWDAADRLVDVLDEYKSRFHSIPGPPQPQEEESEMTRRYLAQSGTPVAGALAVQLTTAKSLWIHVSSITENRSPRPGNQLNTSPGTRVFFGFGAEAVPKGRILGTVDMRIQGHSYIGRTVKYGSNGMDILNLPTPDHHGIDTYLKKYLVFSRDKPSPSGLQQFTLTVTDAAGIDELKKGSVNNIDLKMAGGRAYGLLF